MITFELETGQIITLNNDSTFKIVNSKPRNNETMFDKRGTFTYEETLDNVKIKFNIIEQYENNIYKPYMKSLKIEFLVYKNLEKVKLLKWSYKDTPNSYEGKEFSIKILEKNPGFLA